MKLRDIVSESLNLAHYGQVVQSAIEESIIQGLSELYQLKGKYPKLEAQFNSGEMDNLATKLRDNLGVSPKGLDSFSLRLSNNLKNALNAEFGERVVGVVNFKDIAGNAHVVDNEITINRRLINRLATKTINKLLEVIVDNYDDDKLNSGLWFILRSINGDADVKQHIIDNIEIVDDVKSLTSTVVHEMVHIIQHHQEKKKNPDDETEYRSYLDRKKHEFRLSHIEREKKAKHASDNDQRYYDLYYSSPQEIRAFANEVALKIIDDAKLNDKHTAKSFADAVKTINGDVIVAKLDDRIKKRFKIPDDRKRYSVHKRYLKQVYQSLQDYIGRRMDALQKQQNLNERAIGKKMGHDLYVHKDYVDQTTIPSDLLAAAQSKLPKDYEYTAVRYNSKDGSFAFIQSPDFDTADEPTVGVSLKVSSDGTVKRTNPPADPWIWHNKWMWVGDDYTGFDVEKAKERSRRWKDYIGVNRDVSSRIGKKSYWDTNIVPNLK